MLLREQLADAAERTPMNTEMARVLHEAKGWNVTVNGWKEGTWNVPGFVRVTDNTTGATFTVKCDETLADALGRAQAQMAAGRSPARPTGPSWSAPRAYT